ncbi:NERD domain-containing protein [Parabacteroides sp.]
MSKFQESKLNFDFKGAGWNVIKYDEHLAHGKIRNALHPTKAVDFLGIYNDKKLYFVEVKNYKEHTSDPETKDVLKAGGEELMRRIAVKVRDTIAGATNAARFSTNERAFFTRFNEILLNDAEKVVVIAWIEFDEMNEDERKTKMSVWQQKLKQKLSWLHAAKISINSIDAANEILPETDISFA